MENETRSVAVGSDLNAAVLRLALIFAVAAFAASLAPAPLVLPTLSALLNTTAFIVAFMAAIARQPLWADGITRWDEAALLLAASLFTGMFVDVAAIEALLAEASQAVPAAAEAVSAVGDGV